MKTASKKPAKPAAPGAPQPAAIEKHIPIKKIAAFIVLAAIVTFAGILTYHHDQQRKATERAYQADKARFAAVEADMQKAFGDSYKVFGNPVKTVNIKDCSRVALKYNEGRLSCGITLKAIYSPASYSELSKNVPTALNAISKYRYQRDDEVAHGDNIQSPLTINLKKFNREQCQMTIQDIGSDLSMSDSNFKDGVTYSLSCSGNVKTAIYPLAE